MSTDSSPAASDLNVLCRDTPMPGPHSPERIRTPRFEAPGQAERLRQRWDAPSPAPKHSPARRTHEQLLEDFHRLEIIQENHRRRLQRNHESSTSSSYRATLTSGPQPVGPRPQAWATQATRSHPQNPRQNSGTRREQQPREQDPIIPYFRNSNPRYQYDRMPSQNPLGEAGTGTGRCLPKGRRMPCKVSPPRRGLVKTVMIPITRCVCPPPQRETAAHTIPQTAQGMASGTRSGPWQCVGKNQGYPWF